MGNLARKKQHYWKNWGWVSEKVVEKIPELEKIWWVGIFFAILDFYSIPSRDFFLIPPVKNTKILQKIGQVF